MGKLQVCQDYALHQYLLRPTRQLLLLARVAMGCAFLKYYFHQGKTYQFTVMEAHVSYIVSNLLVR
jgi:hypothetical protein